MYSPNPGNPRTIRELFHWAYNELRRVGSEIGTGGGGGEANEIGSTGVGTFLSNGKSGVTLLVKSLIEGAGITITPTANDVIIAATGASGRVTLIQNIDLSTAGELDFDNIPQTYDQLILEAELRGTVSDFQEGSRLFLNGDLVETTYHSEKLRVQNGSVVTGPAPPTDSDDSYAGTMPGATSPINSFGMLRITFPAYKTGNRKQARVEYQSYLQDDNQQLGTVGVVSAITAPITRIRYRTDNHPTDLYNGSGRLYGVSNA